MTTLACLLDDVIRKQVGRYTDKSSDTVRLQSLDFLDRLQEARVLGIEWLQQGKHPQQAFDRPAVCAITSAGHDVVELGQGRLAEPSILEILRFRYQAGGVLGVFG